MLDFGRSPTLDLNGISVNVGLSPTEINKSTAIIIIFTMKIFKFKNLEGFCCLL
jgi:hypothetical protein